MDDLGPGAGAWRSPSPDRRRLPEAVKEWGLIPNDFWRHGGATFRDELLPSTAGRSTCWANRLFPLDFRLSRGQMFQGPAKRRIPPPPCCPCPALFGHVAHILMDPHSTIPYIGASGGISGVIAFYALRFPRCPARAVSDEPFSSLDASPGGLAFAFWLLLQLVAVAQQLAGVGHVSALAHLGGCLIGLAAFLIWRFREKLARRRPVPSPSDRGLERRRLHGAWPAQL